ncbi:transposase [Actinomyces naeslundii]|uniref:transposase n=1 Tax=Actinomyces naeslundii TaxID=1655 RepID=UPI003B979A28
MPWDSRKYPDELRGRATRMALDALVDPARAKGAIRRIGEELGVHPEALRTWVKKAQVDGGLRPGTTTDEAQRIRELEKEVRELRRANAILKSASACLSRRSVSAHPVDLPVHCDQEGGVWGLADLQGAHWRRSQDRPEHVTHARRSWSPSARSLRDEILKARYPRSTKEPATRCWGPARCT